LAADLTNAPSAGLTPKDVGRLLLESGITERTAATAVELLETCDAARYGGAGLAAADLAGRAESVLEAIQAELRG
jgi:hypothetical protein